MTKLVANAEYLPVNFRLYHNHTYGENKGKPNPATFVTLTLQRFVGCDMGDRRYETVGHTLDRLKDMLKDSGARYQILTAQETDRERAAYRAKHNLEVVNVVEVKEEQSPIIIDADYKDITEEVSMSMQVRRPTKMRDEPEERVDTGRVTHKRGKKVAPKEARVAA